MHKQVGTTHEHTLKAFEGKVRRVALRHGLRVEKARGMLHLNNHGLFQLIDNYSNTVVGGVNYDMTLQGILDHCAEMDRSEGDE
jgi:hypothetical protein